MRDRSATSSALGGFVNVRRVDLVARYERGGESAPFAYDLVTREALDAVVMAAHYVDRGTRYVFLRSAVRPPLALREIPPAHDGALWELPAGLVEPGESPESAAAREIEEELGLHVERGRLRELGGWTFPAPGIIGERHLFFHVEVDPHERRHPTEDGSALERGASIVALPLRDLLEHCRRGSIRDAKTELALRRLMEIAP